MHWQDLYSVKLECDISDTSAYEKDSCPETIFEVFYYTTKFRYSLIFNPYWPFFLEKSSTENIEARLRVEDVDVQV